VLPNFTATSFSDIDRPSIERTMKSIVGGAMITLPSMDAPCAAARTADRGDIIGVPGRFSSNRV